MPWFAVDDGFYTHPKVRKAGNAAAGLFCRLGAHCAKHLTEGLVDGPTVRDCGTPAQIQKLITVGMLHGDGHTCRRCPQPEPGDYVLHDYLDYNRSRKQVEAARESGRKRQQKGRERQAQDRTGSDSKPKRDSNATRNERGMDSSAPQNEPRFQGASAGQGDVSRRYTLEGATAVPSPPSPSVVPPLEEQQEETASYAREPDARIGDRPRIPDASRPLVDAITAAGMVVGWDLQPAEWFLIEALIKRCGVNALVISAKGSWQGARSQPRSGRYFLPAWRDIPDAPEQTPGQPGTLPAAVGEVVPLPRTTPPTHNAGVLARYRARIQQENQ